MMWHTKENITNRNGALICRLNSDTVSEEAIEVFEVYVGHSQINICYSLLCCIWMEHKDKRKSMCKPINMLNAVCICHLLINSFHSLKVWKIDFINYVKFPELKVHFKCFHKEWTSERLACFNIQVTVLKVIMYFLPLTHLCWSCPLVKKVCKSFIWWASLQSSSLKQWKIPLAKVGGK